jgi:hypothetical protein
MTRHEVAFTVLKKETDKSKTKQYDYLKRVGESGSGPLLMFFTFMFR